MPGGSTLVGYGAFVLVKAGGYVLAGFAARRRHPGANVPAVAFGVVRTLIGILFGVAVGGICRELGATGPFPILAALLPIRLVEWWLVLRIFVRDASATRGRIAVDVAYGTAWSYVLDVIGIVSAFVVPGGFWVC